MRRIPATASRVCLFVVIAVSLSLLSLPAGAQSFPYPAVQARVTQAIDESKLVTLAGHVHPQARAEFDQGTVADSVRIDHLIVELKRSPEQDAAAALLVDQLHNQNSEQFHQWLTPEDFGRHFGPADSDLAQVTNWLRAKGFTIEDVPPGRTHIVISGTAGQLRTALHTQLHNLNVNGEKHVAVLSEPQIPAALAPVIAGFRQLNDWHAKPLYQPAGAFQRDNQKGVWRKASDSASAPELTVGSGEYYAVGPQDWYTIYNSRPLYQAGITGAGTTIAVLEETEVANQGDVASFRSQFGLPAYPALPNSTQGGVNWVYGPGNGCAAPPRPTSTSEETEALLDVEWAGAIAPNAVVDFVACKSTNSGIGSYGTDLAASYVANYLSSTVVATSLSYGECELGTASAGALYYRNLWQQLAAEGITAVVSAGDSGSMGCGEANPSTNAMSSTPYNISAGGTDFSDYYQTSDYNLWWNNANGTGYGSALSYIPEVTWGGFCSNPLLASYLEATGNTSYGTTYTPLAICNSPKGVNDTNPVGGGGGISLYNALPAWQGGVYGIGNTATSTSFRNEPDLSFFASAGFWGHFLPYCQSDTGYACNYSVLTDAQALGAGGTSFVAPQIAGLMALINQHTGARQSVANYTLYNLAANEYGTTDSPNSASLSACSGSGKGAAVGGSCIFRDIANDTPSLQGGTITSDIVQPCLPEDVTNCYTPDGEAWGLSSVGDRSSTLAYQTAPGYDAATGLGSANVYNLVMGWNSGGSFSSTATISANPVIVTPAIGSTTLTATVVATGRGGKVAPVGTVSFFIGSTSGKLLGTVNLSAGCSGSAGSTTCAGTAALTLPASRLTAGSNSIIASFGGDGANDAPSSSAPVTVLYEVGPDLTISASSSGSFTQGQTGAVYTITVSNIGGSASSGTVTVTDTLPTGLTATAIGGTGWSCTLSALTCTRADALAAGSSYPAITLTVNVAGNAPASLTDTATVAGGGDVNTGNNSANNSATVLLSGPDLTITKSHSGNFTQGQTGAYTITVSNIGGSSSSGTVTVTDTLPTGLTAAAIGGTGWSCTLSTVTCTRTDALSALASYPVLTLTVGVAGNAPSLITNTAAVSGGGDVNLTNNTASNATTVIQLAGNIITVAGDGTPGFSGDNGPATSAELADPIGVAEDAQGNLYIADYMNLRVRKVNAATGAITTVAGNGTAAANGDNGPAVNAELPYPMGTAVDGAGNLYIANLYGSLILKVSPTTGMMTIVAGLGGGCAAETDPVGDGCPAVNGSINGATGMAADLAGNLYIADYFNNRIRKVTAATGVITTVAGNGYTDDETNAGGYSGDWGPATSAMLNNPEGVAVDANGNLYIADTANNVVREVSGGVITTIVGGDGIEQPGLAGFSGDGGPAINAELNFPIGVAVDSSFNLYIADVGNSRVREVSAGTQTITTLAGDYTAGYNGDGGTATSSELNTPYGVAVDPAGNVYIVDTLNQRIREVGAANGTRTITATALTSSTNPALPASSVILTAKVTTTGSHAPVGVVTFYDGTVALGATWLNSSQVATFTTSSLTLGIHSLSASYSGDPNNLTNTSAVLSQTITGNAPAPALTSLSPSNVANGSGAFSLLVNGSSFASSSTVLWNGSSRTTTFVSSTQLQAAITAADVAMPGTATVTVTTPAPGGGVSSGLTFTVELVSGIASVAGDETAGYSGDNGLATSAELNWPQGVALDASGNLYIADTRNNRIRKVSGGEITTVAGNGTAGYNGDNIPATSAELNQPVGVAVDASGNLYIADSYNNRIRKVSGGTITTVAGTGTALYNGDNILATLANIAWPAGITFDSTGNLFIADSNNSRIRKITMGTGMITTVAGNGTAYFGGDNGPATSAMLDGPNDVAFDAAGLNMYIADMGNNRVRKVNLTTGVITTVAGDNIDPCGLDKFGDPLPCYIEDGVPATSSMLISPAAVLLDAAGNLYIADSENNRVREVNPTTQVITTATAGLGMPMALAMDAGGDLYIADAYYSVVRVMPGQGSAATSVPILTETCPAITYDGNAHGCTASATTAGGVTVSGTWSLNPVSETAVGSYTVIGTFLSANSSYRGGVTSQTLTISARPVTATVTVANKAYDGTTTATVTGCTLSGVLPADQGNLGCSVAAANFASPAPGAGIPVTATGISLSGSAIASYALTTNTATTTASISLMGHVVPYMTSQQVAVSGNPEDVVVDNNGNMYVANGAQVLRIDAVTGANTVFAGGGVKGAGCPTPDTKVNGGGNRFGDGCAATYAYLGNVRGLAINATYLYIADENQSQIHRVGLGSNPLPGQLYANEAELVAGDPAVIGHNPRALAVDKNGNVFWGGPGISMANYSTNPPTVNNLGSSLGVGGVINGLTFDQKGNLYFVNKSEYGVFKLAPNPGTGVVDGTNMSSTLIGNNQKGSYGGPWFNTLSTPGFLGSVRSVTVASRDANTLLPNTDNLYVSTTNGVWFYDAQSGWAHQILKSATALGCAANSTWPYLGCPAPQMTFAGAEGGARMSVDQYGNLYIADFSNHQIVKVGVGADFTGTAPAISTNPNAPTTQTILIHGTDACSGTALSVSSPFALGSATCSSYSVGDAGTDWVVPVTYTSTADGYQTATLTLGSSAIPLDGYGKNIQPVTITCNNKSKTYGALDPTFTFSSNYTIGSWSTSPVCAVTGEIGVSGSPYAITVTNCAHIAAVGFGPFTCNPGQLTVASQAVTAAVTAANKWYDGTTTATITSCTLSGVAPADQGNVTCAPAAANFATANSGTGITVTATGITLSGSAAGNYTLTSTTATTTANIASANTNPIGVVIPYWTTKQLSVNNPEDVVVDQSGNMYVASGGQVLRIDAVTGASTVFAGGGTKGDSCNNPDLLVNGGGNRFGDGCPATYGFMGSIRGLAINATYLYIGDENQSQIHRVGLSSSALPGQRYVHELELVTSGAGNPYGLAVDAYGNVFWGHGDSYAPAVMMANVSTNPPTVHTVVNYTAPGNSANYGCPTGSVTPASSAPATNIVYGLAFDQGGNLYFIDKGCSSVKKVTPNPSTGVVDGTGTLSLLMGNGTYGTYGGPWYNTLGTPAYMGHVRSLATASRDPNTLISNTKDLYVSTTNGIWFYDAKTGWAHQIMKSATVPSCGVSSTGCPAPQTAFGGSTGGARMSIDQYGNLYVAARDSSMIYKVAAGTDFMGTAPTVTTSQTAPVTQSVLIHSTNPCSGTALATSSPFALGSAACTSYSVGDDGTDWVIPVTYTPTTNGNQAGILAVGSLDMPLDGYGKVATVTASVTALSKVYDGTTTEPVANVTCTLTPSASNLGCAVGAASFATVNVGTGIVVTASGITLTGSAAGGYMLSSTTATTTANITQATVTATVTALSKVYDGTNTESPANVTCTLTPSVSNLGCAVGTARFAQSNVGTGITVTASGITLTGSAATNYKLSSTTATTTANITLVTVTATVTALSKTYDGTTSEPNFTCQTTPNLGNLYCTAATVTFAQSNVGTGIPVAVTGIMLYGSAASDCAPLSSTTATVSANITTATVTPSVTALSKLYDGTTTEPLSNVTCSLTPSLSNVSCSVAAATFAQANLGKVITVTATGITLSGSAASNCALSTTSATTTASIIAPSGTPATVAVPYMTSQQVASSGPEDVVVDNNGNMYVANGSQVLKIDAVTGVSTVFVGGGSKGTSCPTPDLGVNGGGNQFGDGCPAGYVSFGDIRGLAIDTNYLYVGDENQSQIHRIPLSNSALPGQLYANEGELVAGGAGNPYGIAVDAHGNVFWGHGSSYAPGVLMANESTKPPTIQTVVNAGQNANYQCAAGASLTVTPASSAGVGGVVSGLTFDKDGNLFFVDRYCYNLQKVAPNPSTGVVDGTGTYSTLVGNGSYGNYGGPWFNTQGTPAYMGHLRSVAAASRDANTLLPDTDDLYISTSNGMWFYDAQSGWAHMILKTAGDGNLGCTAQANWPYTGCPAPDATFSGESGGGRMSVDRYGNLYIADFSGQIIKAAAGTDFGGTAPNSVTAANAPVTQTALVHGPGSCSGTALAATSPFDLGTTSCSSYSGVGDNGSDWLIPITYAPTANGAQAGSLAVGSAELPLDGYGSGVGSGNQQTTVTASVTALSMVYNGTTTEPVGNVTCTLTPSESNLGCVASAATFASANVGTGIIVSVTGISLSGSAAGNYTLSATTATTTANITAASVTPSVSALSMVYNGTTTEPVGNVTCTLTPSVSNLACAPTAATFASANVASGITVTATGIALSGSAASNYALSSTSATTTANITAVSVTPSVTALSMVYNGMTTEPVGNVACTLTPSVSNLTCAPTAAAFASANVGTGITVTATGIALSGSAASNYALSSTSAITTANITAVSVTPSVTALSMVYNGTTTEPVGNVTCTLTPSVSNLTCAPASATFASANVGTGITVTASGIALSGSAAGNYSLSSTTATTTANITAASVTPSVTALSMVYNGTTTEPVGNVTCTLTPSVSNLTCAPASATFASANVGTGITVTASGIALSGSAAGNYSLSSTTATTTANITAASVTPSVTALSMVYNGTTTEPVGNVTCTLTPSVSNLTCAPASAAFASANVGTGIMVTATGIALSGSAASNYALSSTSATTTANITAASVTPSVTALSMVYNGTTTEPVGNVTCTLTPSVSNLTCAPASAAFASANVGTGITVTAAGIALSGSAASNYALSTTSATTTANITAVSVTPSVTALSMVYNGTTTEPVGNVTCTLTPSVSNLTCAPASAAFASANVGTGITVTAAGIALSGSAASNYALSTTSATTTANITAVSVTPSVTALSMVYNGTTTEPVGNVTCTLTPSVSNLTCAPASAAFASANVGTGITVTAAGIALSGSAASNYALSTTSATTTANITAVSVTPSVTALSMVYNGTTTEPVGNVTCTLTPSESNLTCAPTTATFASANVGTSIAVTTTGITLGGSAAGNFVLTSTTAATTASITKATVTATVTALSMVYNGTTTEPIASITCAPNVLAGDSGKVSCAGTAASFASANVGSGITVTVTGISLSGTAAGNYTLSSSTATTTANITAASVTASVTATSKVYDTNTTEPVASVTCTLTPSVSNLTCAPAAATFASANVGTGIAVTTTGITLGGSAAGNYALTSTTAATTANITVASVTASVTALSKIYNGNTTEPIASITCTPNVLAGDSGKVSCAGTAATFASANVGSGITVTVTGISLSGTAASNYTLSSSTATTTASITAASVTASVTATSKVYNTNTTEPVASVTCTLTPTVSNLTCAAGAATFASANVGTGITVTATGITLGGSAASNYALSSTTATTTASITQATVTATVTALSKVYDTTTTEPIASITCTPNVLSGDTSKVSCAGTAATFASSSVGTGITVTVTGISLSGTAAANYKLSSTSATTTASITKATPTVTLTCPTVTYNGQSHTCTATAKGVGGVTVSGSFVFNPASETAVGVYTITGSFTSTNSNYANGSNTGTLTINAS